ncbi:MAG: TM2 domain-containing protein [Spirulinaceae cyanobacterium RM2_2_10]|nr:TM2 domain-containing protein [Spirulinaceae cyanobacterium SM2_1_0]NJO20827.1 TM2 domain-containing protein [Spirulinaceae cyanobacterium RM2_2_10]
MTSNPPKSKIAAALLCFFLGVFGIHRFYLGYTGLGIAQLLTCGGCGIWSLVDFVLILTGGLKDSEGRDLEGS